MDERRREKRLRYHWPVWFSEDYSGVLSQGQMIDVSSGGAAFTCYSDRCPSAGQHITTRFSVPKYHNENESDFSMENFVRDGYVCRVETISPFVHRVALQFADDLPFKPAETETKQSEAIEDTKTMLEGLLGRELVCA